VFTLTIVRSPMTKKRIGKWIEGLDPDMPVTKAAKKTLRHRLDAVWKILPHAAQRARDTTEYVHQVRVATRRAMAALQGYAELLPPRKAERMQKHLKQIRRYAGDARDYDVMIERLRARPDAEHLEPLIDRIVELREQAQEPIAAVYRKLRKRNFPRRVKRLLKKIHQPLDDRHTTFVDWARLSLARNLETFSIAASADLADLPTLHQFRIEGKLLRYAMEYFSVAFDGELRNQLYPDVERLQSLLGIVNDYASAISLFETWRTNDDDATIAPLLDAMLADEREALRLAQQEFFRWWSPQRAADFRRRFNEFLQLPGQNEVA
jgi:CHAD domain-containing protein